MTSWLAQELERYYKEKIKHQHGKGCHFIQMSLVATHGYLRCNWTARKNGDDYYGHTQTGACTIAIRQLLKEYILNNPRDEE